MKRGRQRCRARLLSVVLGVEGLYTNDCGANEGVYHLKVSTMSSLGRQLVKLMSMYWQEAEKVRTDLSV